MATEPRINAEDLKEIYTPRSGQSLTVFIEDAHAVVESRLGASGLSEDLLKAIERYVAAEFATVDNPKAASVSVRGFSKTNEELPQKGRYWAMALRLAGDHAGQLETATQTAELTFI